MFCVCGLFPPPHHPSVCVCARVCGGGGERSGGFSTALAGSSRALPCPLQPAGTPPSQLAQRPQLEQLNTPLPTPIPSSAAPASDTASWSMAPSWRRGR